MSVNRRNILALAAAALPGAALTRAQAAPAPLSASFAALGLDATHFGLRPGSPDDQSGKAQAAIDAAARRQAPLVFPPGIYRLSNLNLPPTAQLVGVRGATRFVSAQTGALLTSTGASHVTLSGIQFDGLDRPSAGRGGMVHFENARALKISDCEFVRAGGAALHCFASDGEITGNHFGDVDTAIHSLDARGLVILSNNIAGAANNGIQVWRSEEGEDGTIVAGNRIENVSNRSGGSGQYGNAVNIFRAGNVIVRGNHIAHCAFSAVRGNAASNLHIEGNAVTDAREVALYAEFGLEGALISGNSVDGAAIGISVTNFNHGGRLAVVQGNLIRNLLAQRPAGTDPNDGAGIGIAVEADSAVTGNTIENAPFAGMILGYGRYLRDVAATGNVVRRAGYGIGVSVARGAGSALIANNMLAECARGAVVGMDRSRVVTGDLMHGGSERFAHITLAANTTR